MYFTKFWSGSRRNALIAATLFLSMFGGTQHMALADEAPQTANGWFGVGMQAMTDDLARAFGLRHTEGVLVTEVIPGSPAERAAMHTGDVIIKFDDKSVTSPEGLTKKIRNIAPGKHVRVEVVRFWGKVRLLRALIESHASSRPATHIRSNPKFEGLEIRLSELTLADRVRLGTGTSGVMVKEAGENTPQLHSGDVIVMAADEPVNSVQGFIDLIGSESPGRVLPILIQRQHKRQFVAVTMPQAKQLNQQ